MANTFWIKLYLEILDDPKMGALSDRLYRRAIEMFLLAGELENNGYLLPEKNIAWRLRIPFDVLHEDVTLLMENQILEIDDKGLRVKNFEKWQGCIPIKDRMKRYHDRKQKQVYYGGDNKVETGRFTYKNRLNKNIVEKNRKEEIPAGELEAVKVRMRQHLEEAKKNGIQPKPIRGIEQ